MNIGVQLTENMDIEAVREAGCGCIELLYRDAREVPSDVKVTGLEVSLSELTADRLFDAIARAKELEVSYIVIDTRGVASADVLRAIIEELSMYIADMGVSIYISNGYKINAENKIVTSELSEAVVIKNLVAYANDLVGQSLFGACVDIGAANVVSKNIRALLDSLGDDVKLIHINDNDGTSDQKQMPYTFTTGRGALSTDWNRIVGAMMRLGYDGDIIFNTTGVFARAPKPVHKAMCELLLSIGDSFVKQFNYEEILARPGKDIILFGAGLMARHYLHVWGDKYKPIFLVDNNSNFWGQNLQGIAVKSPKDILKIPQDKRTVIICNIHYNEIKAQLMGMGIEYEVFNDEFYM